jgi:spore coat protein U-like protein
MREVMKKGREFMKKILMFLVAAAVVLTSVNAMAQQDTNALTATATVVAICNFTSVTNLDFGTYDTTVATDDDDGVGDANFRCTKGTAWDVYITGARTMTDGTDTLNFEIYTDAPGGAVWPATSVGETGTTTDNTIQTQNVFGRITALQDVQVGVYNGSVTVTVDY